MPCRYVSTTPPCRTGRATFTASGSTPSVCLHASMKCSFPFRQLHRGAAVYRLRVRCIPWCRSFRRLGAFAMRPHPHVRGFPTRRLLCPSRRFPGHWGVVGVSLTSFPLPFASLGKSPGCTMWDANEMVSGGRSSWPPPRCAASQYPPGVRRCVQAPFQGTTRVCPVGPYFRDDCRLDWLASQTRDARVALSRRAMRTSGAFPCHLSAKRAILGTCLPLITPLSNLLLTSRSGL